MHRNDLRPKVGSPEWVKEQEAMKQGIRNHFEMMDFYKATEGRQYASPLRYPGGKSRVVSQILEQVRLLPRKDRDKLPIHYEYVEPMVGGGSVFMAIRNTRLFNYHRINDKFSDLMDFWTVAQDPVGCETLIEDCMKLLELDVDQRKAKYLELRDSNFEFRQQRALRFFFINRCSFSGTTESGGFSKDSSMNRFNLAAVERLRCLPEALKYVKITNVDYKEVMKVREGHRKFYFFDPPYFTAKKLYGKKGDLHQFDHEGFAHHLRYTCSGNFLITYDDCPEIREMFSWATIVPFQVQYGMDNCGKSGKPKKGSEIFIRNY